MSRGMNSFFLCGGISFAELGIDSSLFFNRTVKRTVSSEIPKNEREPCCSIEERRSDQNTNLRYVHVLMFVSSHNRIQVC